MQKVFENWMTNRKLVLLNQRKEKLFKGLKQTPEFRLQRSRLFETLSKIEYYKKEDTASPPISLEIPLIA
jgi:hypothetical protein